MNKNRTKSIIDTIKLVLLILILVLFKLELKTNVLIGLIVSSIFLITLIIIDLIYWLYPFNHI